MLRPHLLPMTDAPEPSGRSVYSGGAEANETNAHQALPRVRGQKFRPKSMQERTPRWTLTMLTLCDTSGKVGGEMGYCL